MAGSWSRGSLQSVAHWLEPSAMDSVHLKWFSSRLQSRECILIIIIPPHMILRFNQQSLTCLKILVMVAVTPFASTLRYKHSFPVLIRCPLGYANTWEMNGWPQSLQVSVDETELNTSIEWDGRYACRSDGSSRVDEEVNRGALLSMDRSPHSHLSVIVIASTLCLVYEIQFITLKYFHLIHFISHNSCLYRSGCFVLQRSPSSSTLYKM